MRFLGITQSHNFYVPLEESYRNDGISWQAEQKSPTDICLKTMKVVTIFLRAVSERCRRAWTVLDTLLQSHAKSHKISSTRR